MFVFQSSKSQVFIRQKNLNADSSIHYFEAVIDPDPEVFYLYSIDYGKNRFPGREYIADSSGKKIKFRSGMDMLQHVTNNGWKLAQRNITSNARSNQKAFLLFERK